jgi:hypothetical protein
MRDLYMIEWLDAYSASDPSWSPLSKLRKPSGILCVSVGWIMKESKRNLTIVPHICDTKGKKKDRYFCGEMTIPKGCITKKTKLRKWHTRSSPL